MPKDYFPIFVNKTKVDLLTQPIAFKVHFATDQFIKEGTKLNTRGPKTLAALSHEMLEVMGISMVFEGELPQSEFSEGGPFQPEFSADYSFMTAEAESTRLDNPHIKDRSAALLKPQLIDAADKFIAVDDPFYEQDEELPTVIVQRMKQAKERQKLPLILVARDMYVLSMDKNIIRKSTKNKYLSGTKNRKLRRFGR